MTVTVSDDVEVVGSITPRLYTPPLVAGPPGPCGCGCALTPDTSYGFAVIDFASDVLKRPLWPWQRWLVIHAGELEGGIPRFRRVIVTVGRQSGKTEVVIVLVLYWLFEQRKASVLGTSTLTKYAKKPWLSAFRLAVKALPGRMPFNPFRNAMIKAAGSEEWWTGDDCHYSIAASNAEGGRSMTNDRVVADEFAKQYTYDAYGAAYYSMDALDDAQYFALTTPDPRGVPYLELRESALTFVDTGVGDPTLGLFEWSADPALPDDDPRALAQSNPTAGRPAGKRLQRLLNEARAALAQGGELLRTFKIEVLCQQVDSQDLAIDQKAWRERCEPGDMESVRAGVVLCFEVAPSMLSATLYAAAVLPDGRVRIEAVEAWSGPGCPDRAGRDLPALVARVKPRAFGWLPGGPAEAVQARLKDRSVPGRRSEWPPRGVVVEEIRADVAATCMGFAELVVAGGLVHSGDPLLDADVAVAQKAPRPGGSWVFSRRGDGDCDAIYSAAGAVHLARTRPPSPGGVRIISPRKRHER